MFTLSEFKDSNKNIQKTNYVPSNMVLMSHAILLDCTHPPSPVVGLLASALFLFVFVLHFFFYLWSSFWKLENCYMEYPLVNRATRLKTINSHSVNSLSLSLSLSLSQCMCDRYLSLSVCVIDTTVSPHLSLSLTHTHIHIHTRTCIRQRMQAHHLDKQRRLYW